MKFKPKSLHVVLAGVAGVAGATLALGVQLGSDFEHYHDYLAKVSYGTKVVDFKSTPVIKTLSEEDGKVRLVDTKAMNFGDSFNDYSYFSHAFNYMSGRGVGFHSEEFPLQGYYQQEIREWSKVDARISSNNEKLNKPSLPISKIIGKSFLATRESFPSADFRVCIVQSKQSGALSHNGSYYLFRDDMPIYSEKNVTDFLIKSHEAGHCYFRLSVDSDSDVENNYKNNLNEVAGDLAAVLDYMRVNGNADIYTKYWRTYRLASVEDDQHQTAWALDVILKDPSIDPHALQRKDVSEIGPIVQFLMEKHFSDGKGNYGMSVVTPAAKALRDNLDAQKWLADRSKSEYAAVGEKLKSDLYQSLADHRATWEPTAPADAVELFNRRLQGWSAWYDIPVSAQPSSSLDLHSGKPEIGRRRGVLEYVTGSDHAL